MYDLKNKNTVIDPEEFSAAEMEAQNSKTGYTHKFNKPFTYQGVTYNELSFDWDKLNGADSIAIENELQQLGKTVIVPTFSSEYLVRVAAKACNEKIGYDALLQMPIADYNRIRSNARSFLLKAEL